MDKVITDKVITQINRFSSQEYTKLVLKVKPEYWDQEDLDTQIYNWTWSYAHSENGPAFSIYSVLGLKEKLIQEEWFSHGIRNRNDGPAIIFYKNGISVRETYYIDGEYLGENLSLYSREQIDNYLILK